MQTFLPYPSIDKSAECLDYKRLGKQRVEAWQIYCALTNSDYGWQNHPAVKMWRGYEYLLIEYGMMMSHEWFLRGYNGTIMEQRFDTEFAKFKNDYGFKLPEKPFWWGDDAFHASHRSNLLRKNPEYYSQFGWTEPDNLPYVWPVK